MHGGRPYSRLREQYTALRGWYHVMAMNYWLAQDVILMQRERLKRLQFYVWDLKDEVKRLEREIDRIRAERK